MKKRLSLLVALSLAVTTAFCGYNPQPVMAASARSKAISAYNKFMSKKSIPWGDGGKASTYKCQYYIIDVDDNSVPELLVTNSTAAHMDGNTQLYTYTGGKVKYIDRSFDGMEYYSKKGVYTVEYLSSYSYETSYMKLSGGSKYSVASKSLDMFSDTYTYYNASGNKITKTEFDKICSQNGIIGSGSDVSISEESSIKSFLNSKGVLDEIAYMTIFRRKSPNQKTLKADLSVRKARNMLYWQELWQTSYAEESWGQKGALNNSSNLSIIASSGKSLFGNNYSLSFSNSTKSNAFYFISADKKYILDNIAEVGDDGVKGKYSAIYKSGNTYVVKYTCRNYAIIDGKEDLICDAIVTLTLKKDSVGNFYISSIKWKSYKR